MALTSLGLFASTALAETDAVTQCIISRLETTGDDVTLGALRSACREQLATPDKEADLTKASVVGLRQQADFDIRDRQFAISPNRANYIIYTYNDDPNEDPFEVEPSDFLQEHEMKFQVSFKMPLATELFNGNTDLLFAYTSVAWWQTFNNDIANPFRETNYEPEFIFRTYTDTDILGLHLVNWELGYNHQSNGQSEPTSRGWDRATAAATFELDDDTLLGVRAWHQLDEQDNNSDHTHTHTTK